MGYKRDWNSEVIAQFYATCYFEESGNVRNVHWMTEGTWYSISHSDFGMILGFGAGDRNRVKLHLGSVLSKNDMSGMYM